MDGEVEGCRVAGISIVIVGSRHSGDPIRVLNNATY